MYYILPCFKKNTRNIIKYFHYNKNTHIDDKKNNLTAQN